jgi:hypothetical protein
MKRLLLRLALAAGALALGACTVNATTDPVEHCRTAEVRNHRDLESCHTRCGDEGCRTHCKEREHWARENHCWAD